MAVAATERSGEDGGIEALDSRDVRALTQYLTVLDDVGRAAGGASLGNVGDAFENGFEGSALAGDGDANRLRLSHCRTHGVAR